MPQSGILQAEPEIRVASLPSMARFYRQARNQLTHNLLKA